MDVPNANSVAITPQDVQDGRRVIQYALQKIQDEEEQNRRAWFWVGPYILCLLLFAVVAVWDAYRNSNCYASHTPSERRMYGMVAALLMIAIAYFLVARMYK